MVPLCLGNDWRSVSGTLGFYAFYSHHFRYGKQNILRGSGHANGSTGPRFALVGLWYLLTARPNATLPKFVAAMGLFRTLTCGGWTYVTSTDDHDWHDIFMISYIVATLPWTLGCIALSPSNGKAVRYRKYLAGSFFGTLVPLIYFFIQHKVHKIAGGKIHIFGYCKLKLTKHQRTLHTPSSSGLWFCLMWALMLLQLSTLRLLSWLLRMSRVRARGTSVGFRNEACTICILPIIHHEFV